MVGESDANHDQTPPNNNTPPRGSRQWPEDDNPFVALRRFADEQISSMLQSFMGLPSMATPPMSDRWSVFDEQNYNNTRLRQAGDGTERDANANANSYKPGDALSRSEDPNEAYRHYNNQWSSFGGSSGFWRSEFDDLLPLASRMLHFSHHFDDGMDYLDTSPGAFLLLSPYSPMSLERRPRRHYRDSGVFSSLMSLSSASDDDEDSAHEPRWHEAFEDLMRLENGKQMLDHDPAVSKREYGMEWLRAMVQRGSMDDQYTWTKTEGNPGRIFMFERGRFPSSEQSDNRDNLPDTLTEQDMYERFLQDLEKREHEFSTFFDGSRILRSVLGEEPHRHREEALQRQRKSPQEINNRNDETESWLESETAQSSTSSFTPETRQDEPAQPRVISTHTNTQRVRMADGSVHTKITKTQRFADGHEESNESVDVVNPLERQDAAASATAGGHNGSANDEHGSDGWFWKR